MMIMINWRNVTGIETIIKLIKQRKEIEQKIIKLDDMALIRYELEELNFTSPTDEDVVIAIKNQLNNNGFKTN